MEPERIATNLRIITQTGRQMTNIVNELLLLASVRRLEDIAMDGLDMQAIVSEALHRFEQRIEEINAYHPAGFVARGCRLRAVGGRGVGQLHQQCAQIWRSAAAHHIGWDYHNTSEELERQRHRCASGCAITAQG